MNEKAGIWCLLGCFAFLLFGSVITVIPEPHYYTATSAITDLMNGSAMIYGKEQKERIDQYRGEKTGIVEVEKLTELPLLLFFSDIAEDTDDWKNKGICRFYELDAVTVKKSD